MLHIYAVSILVNVFISHSAATNCVNPPLSKSETCIKEKILDDYDLAERPRPSTTDPLTIKMDYVVNGFEYDNSLLTIYSFLKMSWKEPNFQWQPADYNNLKYIKMSSAHLWIPDLAVFNAKSNNDNNGCGDVTCTIDHKGNVRCAPICMHEAICESNLKHWPFDRQKCTIDIGSSLDDKSNILFKQEDLSIQHQFSFANREWKLISSKYKTGVSNKSAIGDDTTIETSIISYEFLIERHSILHQMLIVAPSIIMIMINFIAMFIELFNSERFYLLLLNIMLHFMVIEELFWYTPFAGDYVPDVIYYLRDSLIITAFELFVTVLLRAVSRYIITPPIWIETTNNLFVNNPLGFYFIVTDNLKKDNSFSDDDESLVEQKGNEFSKENKKWKQFAKITDRIIFMIVFLTYAILFFRVLPSGYEKL